jgi:hypothetical protein
MGAVTRLNPVPAQGDLCHEPFRKIPTLDTEMVQLLALRVGENASQGRKFPPNAICTTLARHNVPTLVARTMVASSLPESSNAAFSPKVGGRQPRLGPSPAVLAETRPTAA